MGQTFWSLGFREEKIPAETHMMKIKKVSSFLRQYQTRTRLFTQILLHAELNGGGKTVFRIRAPVMGRHSPL